MNINQIRNQLSPDARAKLDNAIDRNNITQAVGILSDAGLVDDAIDYCEQINEHGFAVDIAIQAKRYDRAEDIAKNSNNDLKLAEVLILKGDIEQAARLLTRLQQYERAAKLYIKLNLFEEAALLYAKNGQYMDATMCYQKAGNVPKQLDTQIAAFESELALVNGDINAVNVSRTMAIYAAKILLDNPDSVERALQVLKKAQALSSTANEFLNTAQFGKAAMCFEYDGAYEEARQAYIQDNDVSHAMSMCKKLDNSQLEIDTLKAFQQYFRLGQKYISINQYDDALAALKRVDPADKSYSNSLELQGDIYCKQKNYSDAVLCYESLFWAQLPDDRICRIAYKAAFCYEQLKDFDNALKNYQKVYDINPNFHEISNIIKRVNDKIHEIKESKQNDIKSLSPLEPDRVRAAPSKSIMRTPNRARVSTIRLGNLEVPSIGNERYRIIEEVAHGGMGVVYKATDNILMRTVALKVLSNKLKDNDVALEYFMREARASAALQHINIVTIYDIGSLNDGNVYLAMEYIEGKNLKQLITQTGAFPTKFLVQIAIHACRGLQYAHENGIIHRDIKSSNMMLAKKDKTLKILDMGLAKMVNSEDKNSTQAIGTPYYMSPEQVLGTAIDARSDIYSLGVTLYECATGVLPFVKGDLPYKHVHEAPPPLRSFNDKVNPQIEQIVLKMMEKAPDNRYLSCNDCITALKKVDFNADPV